MIPVALLLPFLICCNLGAFGPRKYFRSTKTLRSSLLWCTNPAKNDIDRGNEDSTDDKVIDASNLMRR